MANTSQLCTGVVLSATFVRSFGSLPDRLTTYGIRNVRLRKSKKTVTMIHWNERSLHNCQF